MINKKYLILVPDGMADYPIKSIGNKTPLMVANTPNMDLLAQKGLLGLAKTVPNGMEPGSDIANFTIMGYDPKYYTGRGGLEAASIGVKLNNNDVAFRCNFITVKDGVLEDYSAGKITDEEGKILIDELNRSIGGRYNVEFYHGKSYRNLMVVRDCPELLQVECTPPHDISGRKIDDYLIKCPQSSTSDGNNVLSDLVDRLNEIIFESRSVLEDSIVNIKRMNDKKQPANMIWLWGQGKRPNISTYQELYGIEGSVITAVDLIKGLGIYAGLDIIDVPGATGYIDSNLLNKSEYALNSLKNKDFVFVHVEATDEMGHEGNLEGKIKAIERFDREILGTILDRLDEFKEFSILLLPDHPTPIEYKTHTSDPVPFVFYDNKSTVSDNIKEFNEESAKKGSLGLVMANKLVRLLFNL